jgi:hypothetical protein
LSKRVGLGRNRFIIFTSAVVALIVIAVCSDASRARAQDLEPRAYSASPIGTNFVLLGYSYSKGDVDVDPSLPISNVVATINVVKLGFSHTFDLGGHMASYALQLPYAQASASGQVYEQSKQIFRSGLANFTARLAVNFIGCPALTPAQFARRKPTTVVGASLTIMTRSGSYDPTHLINIGTNRWAFRPEVGVEQPIGKWFVDGAVGVWFFTQNPDFFGGHTFNQNPLSDFQAHVGYNFRPGFWLAADANYYTGGATFVNGATSNIAFANSRYGVTFAYPLNEGLAAKLAYSSWLSGTFGNRYHTLGLALQYRWFDH